MKKAFSLALSLVIAAALCAVCVLPMAALEPDANYPIAKSVFGSPVIDGEIDSIWELAEVNVIEKTFATNSPDPNDPTNGTKAQFRTMWDSQYLYLLIEVTDSTIGDENWELKTVGAASLWQRNSVGITISPNYNRTATATQEPPAFWIILSCRAFTGDEAVAGDGTANFNQIPRETFKNFCTKITDTGYLIEIAFDLSLRFEDMKMTDGNCIGLDIYVNDNIAGITGSRDIGLMWSDLCSYKYDSL